MAKSTRASPQKGTPKPARDGGQKQYRPTTGGQIRGQIQPTAPSGAPVPLSLPAPPPPLAPVLPQLEPERPALRPLFHFLGDPARTGDPRRVDVGDVLPNLQEAFRPVFRPRQVAAEENILPLTPEERHENRLALDALARAATSPTPWNWQAFRPGLQAVQRTGEDLGFGLGVNPAALPGAALHSADVLARLAERRIGTAEQRLGVPLIAPTVAPVPGGRAIGPILRRVAAQVLREQGKEDFAARLEADAEVEPGLVGMWLANGIARARANGQDTAQAERLLQLVAPMQDPEALITEQADLISGAGLALGDPDTRRAQFDAAEYRYEGLDRMLDMRHRMQQGQSFEEASAALEGDLRLSEQARNLVGQLVLDPLNALDFVKIGAIGGGAAGRLDDFTDAARMTFATELDDVARAAVRTEMAAGNVEALRWYEQAPLVGRVLQRTPETRLRQGLVRATDTVGSLLNGMSPSAAENLRALDILEDPRQVLLRTLMEPDAVGNLDEVLQALGVSRGQIYSRAAEQTRAVLEGITQQGDLLKQWDSVEEAWRALAEAPMGALPGKAARQRDEVYNAALDATEGFLRRFETGTKAAMGIQDTTTILENWRKPLDAVQQVFATYFHMGFSPGWAVRNYLNNSVTLWIDQVDMLTPLRRVQDELAAFGSPSARTTAEAGVQAGREITGGPLRRLLDKSPGFTLGRRIERDSGLRATWEGVRRVMESHWSTGAAIDPASYQQLVNAVGPDLAEAVVRQARAAWTPADLNAVLERVGGMEPWRLVEDLPTQTLDDLSRAGLRGQVLDLMRRSDLTPEGAMQELDTLLQGYQDAVQAAAQTPLQNVGSIDQLQSVAAQEVSEALSLSDEAARAFLNDRALRISATRRARTEAAIYTRQALQNRALPPESLQALDARMTALERALDATTGDYAVRQEQIARAIRAGQWQQIPGFAGLSRDSAWQLYYLTMDNIWTPFSRQYFDEMLALGDEVYQVAGQAPVARPSWTQIFESAPVGEATRAQVRATFRDMAEDVLGRGVSEPQLNNWVNARLREGDAALAVPGEDWLPPEGALTWEWINRATDALQGRLADEAGQLVRDLPEVTETVTDAARAVQQVASGPLTPHPQGNPHDVLEQAVVRRAEAERLLREVGDFIQGRAGLPAPGGLSEAEQRAVRAFVQALHPRLNETRQVATRVGDAVRDFALLNYSDRRNFDTLMGFGFSYPYWYTRNLNNFILRTMDSPGTVVALLKGRKALQRINGNLPEWWQDQLHLKILGTDYFLPILNMIDPLNGYLGDKFRDEDQRSTPLGAIVSELGQYGPGVHSAIQIAMALSANARGNREEALSWFNYLGQPTRAINALSVLGRQAGLDFIPPGGVGAEFWLYDDGRFTGSKWDARRVGKALYDMAQRGDITYEQMVDAAYWQRGAVYDQALQEAAQATAGATLLSWFAGAGFKPRPASEIDIARADLMRSELMRRSPYADDLAPDALSVEQYRQAWRELRDQFPFMDGVIFFRKDDEERDGALAWSVFDRLPPNNRAYLEAVGMDYRLMDDFYNGGVEGMDPTTRRAFMTGIQQLAGVLALPPDATVDEWNDARDRRRAMNLALSREFGDGSGEMDAFYELQDAYYHTRDTQGYEAGVAFLEDHPILEAYWNRRDAYVADDPTLAKYYASMDLLERVARDEFEAEMARQYPNLDVETFWDEYWLLREAGDLEGASALFDQHPEMRSYLQERDVYTLRLRDQLEGMAGAIEALEPRWATARPDAAADTPGQEDVAALIASGSRPMGDFELPEDLDAREVQAALNREIGSIPDGNYGAVMRALRAMGDLDDTLTAFQEFKNLDTAQANITELRALLAALDAIRTDNGWALLDADQGLNARVRQIAGAGGLVRTPEVPALSGSSGQSFALERRRETRQAQTTGVRTPRPRTVRSTTYGGASTAPQTDAQQTQQDNRIGQFLSTLVKQSPTYYHLLKQLAALDRAAARAFLSDPNNRLFARWLLRLVPAFGPDLEPLLGYLRQGLIPPVRQARRSRDFKRGTSQRFSLRRT